MSEFIDEIDTLQTNVEGLKHLSDTLAIFNESFASWLYVMNMNALTVDFPQVCAGLLRNHSDAFGSFDCIVTDFIHRKAPHTGSFMLAKRRAEQNSILAMEALHAAQVKSSLIQPSTSEQSVSQDPESTFTTGNTSSVPPKKKVGAVKGGKKPKLTSKEKKERSVRVEIHTPTCGSS